ncbi:MAG: phage regulatory protein/antirepressor Ant [Muribaculaceae bacterium]|nr:phage regulatory protein/antirepressor Ant [Alistipes senegalensis]MCM1473233.1 phage regulatory protein/antirepressor Ant [Muribaculaceae bacterium]
MYELKPMNFNGIKAVDSRQVAEAVGKNHFDLLRDVRKYCDYLGESKIACTDFFIESTYTTEQNKEMPCYLCTRKGCEMIANKLTRQKGVVFTALYINAFHTMESYIKQDSYMIDDPVKRAERWIEEQKEKQQLITTVAVQEQQINELKPKASYYDVVLNCPDLLTISAIAKDYGKSAKWLNAYLHEHGVQYKQGDIWLLYQKYAQRGYTSTKTHSLNGRDGLQHAKIHTYWTQKGRLFIYDLLKSDGIYPTVEAC